MREAAKLAEFNLMLNRWVDRSEVGIPSLLQVLLGAGTGLQPAAGALQRGPGRRRHGVPGLLGQVGC